MLASGDIVPQSFCGVSEGVFESDGSVAELVVTADGAIVGEMPILKSRMTKLRCKVYRAIKGLYGYGETYCC